MLTPRQEQEFIEDLNNRVKRYSDAPLDIIFDSMSQLNYIENHSFKEVYTADVGRNQHGIQVESVFKVDEYFVKCTYDLPIGLDETKLYETNMQFFYVVPNNIEDGDFSRIEGGAS